LTKMRIKTGDRMKKGAHYQHVGPHHDGAIPLALTHSVILRAREGQTEPPAPRGGW
jgi:hypothetical protein